MEVPKTDVGVLDTPSQLIASCCSSHTLTCLVAVKLAGDEDVRRVRVRVGVVVEGEEIVQAGAVVSAGSDGREVEFVLGRSEACEARERVVVMG